MLCVSVALVVACVVGAVLALGCGVLVSPKSDIQFQGIKTSEQKLGDCLIGQMDIKYNALGYATRMTPQKRGGIRRPRLRLI